MHSSLALYQTRNLLARQQGAPCQRIMTSSSSGPAPAAPAHTLAPSGKRVLLLERGTEDLPMHDSRVTVDKAANDHLAYKTSNDEEAEGIYDELQTVLNHVGLARPRVFDKNFYMTMNILIAGVAHQAGTGRFGTGPGFVGLGRQRQGP